MWVIDRQFGQLSLPGLGALVFYHQTSHFVKQKRCAVFEGVEVLLTDEIFAKHTLFV